MKDEAVTIPRERCDLPPLLDAEAPQAVAPAQGGEALVRHAGGARHKLQQAQSLFIIEALHRSPEPPDDDVPIMIT